MLTPDTRRLLENILEADNRLFDGDSTVRDVHDLIFATGKALATTPFAPAFHSTAERLLALLRSKLDRQALRDEASAATSDLRSLVLRALDSDAKANPKRRHRLGTK